MAKAQSVEYGGGGNTNSLLKTDGTNKINLGRASSFTGKCFTRDQNWPCHAEVESDVFLQELSTKGFENDVNKDFIDMSNQDLRMHKIQRFTRSSIQGRFDHATTCPLPFFTRTNILQITTATQTISLARSSALLFESCPPQSKGRRTRWVAASELKSVNLWVSVARSPGVWQQALSSKVDGRNTVDRVLG